MIRKSPAPWVYVATLPLFMVFAHSVLLFVLLPQGNSLKQASDLLYDYQLTLVTLHAFCFAAISQFSTSIRLRAVPWVRVIQILTPGVTLANLLWVCMAFGQLYPTVFFAFSGPSTQVSLVLWLLRLIFFVVWLWVDTLVLLNILPAQLPFKKHSIRAAVATGVWIFFKWVQLNHQEVALLEWLNLSILGFGIALFSFMPHGHRNSAGFVISFLVTMHFIFGLPILGEELPGLFVTHLAPAASINSHWARVISGAESGPLAGLACVVICLFDLAWMLL